MAQVLFDNCTLLDTPTGEMLEGRSVLVVDDRVEEVSESPITAPNARRIDVGGNTLMPGMIDAHVHCTAATMNLANMAYMPATLMAHEAAAILRGMLARGFTTIRDAAGADRGLAAAVERGAGTWPADLLRGSGAEPDRRPRRPRAVHGRPRAVRLLDQVHLDGARGGRCGRRS